MILECASIKIKNNQQSDFEQTFKVAINLIIKSKGYIKHSLKHCIEEPDTYLLMIEWETLEDHMEIFRKSPAFQEWRKLLSPFFEEPPKVLHYK